jgi:hypothetical protein
LPVTGFEIAYSRLLADGKSFGDIGPYEELRGTLKFAIDPNNPANERITDVALAPRNSENLVEFSSNVSIILPVDRTKANGKMILDVVNRGNRVAFPNFNRASRPTIDENTPVDVEIDVGDGLLMRLGYVIVACGWQIDAPAHPALITMSGPDALDPAKNGTGKPITGRIYSQLQSPTDTYNFLLSDKGHRAYPALDLDEVDAYMEVRDEPDGEPEPVPRESWRFGRIDEDGNYHPDPEYVCAPNKFDKGRLYQIIYTTSGGRILGLSFAALRDCTSWIKHGTSTVATPVQGIGHAIAYGRSQTGRYLRTYVYNDFNLDEDNREALDGVIANVAGGMRGEFNQRFGQNSKDRNNMMSQLFPFASSSAIDQETEEVGSLHARLDERNANLKVFYTNTSAEYHRGDASLLHTDPSGSRDIDAGPNTRIYHFTGTEHGLGVWPPSDVAVAGEVDQDRSQNLRNIIDYAPLLRACLINMDRWVVDGIEPPASRHPRLDDGTGVPTDQPAVVFNGIPEANYPVHHANPRRRDFGLMESREQVTNFPPKVGGEYGSLVSAVDADGNEVAGVKLPEIAVPIAATTGWTLRHPSVGGQTQLLVFAGGTNPFATNRVQRELSGDPRPSVEERYASKDEYLERIRSAGEELVAERYLLAEDIAVSLTQASKYWDWVQGT